MAESGVKVYTFAPQKVAVAKTAIKLEPIPGTVGYAAKTVTVQALSTNANTVSVGDKETKTEESTKGTPTQRGIQLEAKQSVTFELNDPAQLYINSEVAENGVAVTVLIS
jgi:hypothetical protein